MGQHTKVMQVYRHWALRRLSKMVTGTPAAPPIAPIQPKQSRRQQETLLGGVAAVWPPSGTSATLLPRLSATHSLTLATMLAIDRRHWHSEYSHMSSMSEGPHMQTDHYQRK